MVDLNNGRQLHSEVRASATPRMSNVLRSDRVNPNIPAAELRLEDA
jgi:hypothetical protein